MICLAPCTYGACDIMYHNHVEYTRAQKRRALSSFDGVVLGLGINVSDLDYADDIEAVIADSATAQTMLNEIAYFSQLLSMKINTAKTKVMDLNIQSDYQLVLYGQELEKVDSFTYLSSVVDPQGGCDLDV
ncbi:hypothetical protein QYM36_000530 [Artemia franciscana]|uniref:Reverse transcriptase domain-containing protein n=1 Tax=Artemia franciscana TaxID=6661 RepID=A0AA88I8D6_ARTSF|nr:hypothetical protein QYM36_000530 [Artemia franciscana]